MVKLNNFVISTFFIFLICSVPSPVFSEPSMTVQIHPYLPSAELLKKFSPLISYLEKELKTEIACNISKTYQEHIDIVGNDKVDIAYMGPAAYVKMVNKYGSKPLLARLEIKGSPFFQGVIVTNKTSSVSTLQHLKGKRFAFGDPDSTMSHIVPLTVLYDRGIKLNDFTHHSFLHGHRNVALGVLMGDFDAGAVKEEIFHEYKNRGLVDIEWTPKISEHLFVSKSSIPSPTIDNIRAALLSLNSKADSAVILSSIKKDVTALVPVEDKDYDNFRVILNKALKISTSK